MTNTTRYRVTKRFDTGNLAGITITESTSVPFQVGEVIGRSAISPSGYTVLAVEAVLEAAPTPCGPGGVHSDPLCRCYVDRGHFCGAGRCRDCGDGPGDGTTGGGR